MSPTFTKPKEKFSSMKKLLWSFAAMAILTALLVNPANAQSKPPAEEEEGEIYDGPISWESIRPPDKTAARSAQTTPSCSKSIYVRRRFKGRIQNFEIRPGRFPGSHPVRNHVFRTEPVYFWVFPEDNGGCKVTITGIAGTRFSNDPKDYRYEFKVDGSYSRVVRYAPPKGMSTIQNLTFEITPYKKIPGKPTIEGAPKGFSIPIW